MDRMYGPGHAQCRFARAATQFARGSFSVSVEPQSLLIDTHEHYTDDRQPTECVMNVVVSPRIRFGPYAFDTETGELTKNGQRTALRPQAACVLTYLASHSGRLVTREELREHVWGSETYVDFEHGLNLCIHEIRGALHDDASSPGYVETLPRRGYRFIGTVEPDVAPGSSASVREADVQVPNERLIATSTEVPVRPSSRWLRALAILGFVAVLAAIVIVSSRSGMRDTVASPPPEPRIASIALLPLTDLASRPDEDYFADGVTWELQKQMQGVDSLRVTALDSAQAYKKSKKPAAQIARELEVSNLLSGSVIHSAERVRLNMKLTDARTGQPLWAQSYDTSLADLLQTEIKVAHAVGRALQKGVVPSKRREPVGKGPVNAAAHGVFLKAMGAQTTEEYRRGLERALAIDPEFALAWSMLADSYVSDTWFAQTVPPMVGYPKAKELALKALAIDDSDSSAHTIIAAVKLHHEWDWAGAEREFRRAIELSPSDAGAHHGYSHYLLTMDRLKESVAESRIASELDPLSPTLTTCVGWHCLYARQYADAIAVCLKLVNDNKAGPITYYYLGRVYVRQGKLADGIAALEVAEKKSGGLNSVLATLGYAYGRAGRRADAERVLAVLKDRAQRRYVAAFDIAVVYAGLGDTENTFEWLDRAFLERSTWLVHLKWDDRFAGSRTDPRFSALLRRMGIPNPDSVRAPEKPVPERYVASVAAVRVID